MVAVCKLSGDLFPPDRYASPKRVATSVGLMNLAICGLGVHRRAHLLKSLARKLVPGLQMP